jgi:hypothetical protein
VINFREALTEGKKPFVFYQAGDKQKIKSKRVCSFLSAMRDGPFRRQGNQRDVFLKDSC